MSKKSSADMRQHLIDIAKALMAEKGYTAVGLAELVAAAGVPKGSFYYYFKSKEEFGQALLDDYFTTYLQAVDALLAGPGNARERLLAYFDYWRETQASSAPEGKCLVVKLGAEVCDLSVDMGAVLQHGTGAILDRLTQCVEAGHLDGSVATATSARVLAESLYQLWLGASLMVKVARSGGPFDAAMATTQRLLS
ncbi:TetR/AcrR family transcriptional regulator [Janthinobacterium lividum]|uniref:TetR/AcrR family transcriptional regulator n=1 Tax=Janthinobacterium lividum TaxID=29581 RepID=A0ABU0XLB2_9BURK|nr:TetR/AcrR family transcriptional regulator [Janthinobacterium lividum]MDQ4624303.1 TetR/AcrR family transcriptional regulator [Janthinobacterium lividum]MDQ4674093.1 TetR/AcrR family transcriptional regulator [Janthinobacterium lividum]MDQ4684823.1 TetR/AcrR family transcriptional regulator [Janthinobacterium lividum]